MKPKLNPKNQASQNKLRKMLAAGLPLSALLTGLLGPCEISASEPRLVGKPGSVKNSVQQEQPSGKQPEPKPLAGVPPRPVICGEMAAPVYYEVREGDTLYAIAKRHGMTVEQLKKLNGFTDKSASELKVGQKIRIR